MSIGNVSLKAVGQFLSNHRYGAVGLGAGACALTLFVIRFLRKTPEAMPSSMNTLIDKAVTAMGGSVGLTRDVVVRTFDLNAIQKLPSNPNYLIDTDAGNDPDDIFAHVLSAQEFGKRIRLVTTTLYRPEEKAKISKLLNVLHLKTYPDLLLN